MNSITLLFLKIATSKLLALLFFLFTNLTGFSQKSSAQNILRDTSAKFSERFDDAIREMGKANVDSALKILKELNGKDTTHAYVHYLMGVCYTEKEDPGALSIHFLEKATRDIRTDYENSSKKEKRAPVFSYYYLVKAYTKHGLCNKAEDAYENFRSLYGAEKIDFFVINAESILQKCVNKTGEKYTRTSNIITKNIDYTVTTPLYGVQVGAFRELMPIHEFDDIKNIEAFLDKEGYIRYVAGRFILRYQAEALKKVIQDAGYKDAFVVDVNVPKKYSEEIVIVDNRSFRKELEGNIEFSVQLGAFKDSIPDYLVRLYLEIEGIKEKKEGNLTLLAVGSYSTYEDVEKAKENITKRGVQGAFVVAYSDGRRVDVREAKRAAKKTKK